MLNTYIDVPDDIVIEILSRISAKSLLRLRWACKYWFDLITRDRGFIKKHCIHHHTTISNDDDRIINNTSFLLYDYSNSPIVYSINLGDMINNHSVHDDDADGTLPTVNMDGCNLQRLCNFVENFHFLAFYGSGSHSCNGLVLLDFTSKCRGLSKKYFLWNPCTREFKELPCEPTLGFGYDQTIDDYKLLKINTSKSSQLLNDNASDIDNLNMEIGIYTLGSNSWSTKILAGPLVKAHWKKLNGFGLFHNGALHWIKELQPGTPTIICFDIAKEELRDIEGLPFSWDLRVLNGCLCTFQWNLDLDHESHVKTFVIWIMKEYGVKDSWSKLFSINMEKVRVDTLSRPYYSLFPFNQYLKDGGILMLTNRKVIAVYDSKKNDKARFIYSIGDYECRFVLASYIGSLVSLNSGKYSTFAGSRTTNVTKQDLLEYEVVDGCLVKISQQQN